MNQLRPSVPALVVIAMLTAATSLHAAGFTPSVPVSPLALSWFDPSRLHVSTSVSVGSGFQGGGAQALSVTSLNYQFSQPLWMSVSLGNTFGGSKLMRSSNNFFLEGFDLGYSPRPSLQFQIHYRDLRSPLQQAYYSGYPGAFAP